MRHNFDNPNITSKEELNKYVSDEDIISHFFGEFEVDIYYSSPDRSDNIPSLLFDYWNGELKWRDFGRDINPKDAVEFVEYWNDIHGLHLNYYQTLKYIYKQVKKGTCKKHYKKLIKVKNVALKFRKAFHEWELVYWKDYSIDLKTLQYFHVFPCEVWNNGLLWHRSRVDDPSFVYLWSRSREIWKAYRPLAPLQRVRGVMTKRKFFANNTDNHVQGWEYLPPEGDICMITKSYKDIMVLYKAGIPALAPHSENMFLSKEMTENLKERFRHVYVNYDNDKTGVEKSLEYTQEYNLNYWNIPKVEGCKDPSDFAKEYSIRDLRLNIESKFIRDGIKH